MSAGQLVLLSTLKVISCAFGTRPENEHKPGVTYNIKEAIMYTVIRVQRSDGMQPSHKHIA